MDGSFILRPPVTGNSMHNDGGRVSLHSKCFSQVHIEIPPKDQCPFDTTTQKFVCPLCKNQYLTYTSVCDHMKIKHLGRYSVFCNICGKGFQRRAHLRGHMVVHGQATMFECTICGSKYAHKTSLRYHERLVHGIAHH